VPECNKGVIRYIVELLPQPGVNKMRLSSVGLRAEIKSKLIPPDSRNRRLGLEGLSLVVQYCTVWLEVLRIRPSCWSFDSEPSQATHSASQFGDNSYESRHEARY
jgi:hypothetical protein